MVNNRLVNGFTREFFSKKMSLSVYDGVGSANNLGGEGKIEITFDFGSRFFLRLATVSSGCLHVLCINY